MIIESTTNALLVIESLINEHTAINGHMQSVCGLLDNWDENLSFKKLQPEKEQSLNQKGVNLKQTMSYLDEGLKQHHQHEEELLPAIAGEPVLEALKVEHGEITKQLGEINFILRDIRPLYLAANLDYLKLTINNLCNLMNLHISVENTLLNLLKKRYI
jgi:hypothetical protein